jgi:hypothetical protein
VRAPTVAFQINACEHGPHHNSIYDVLTYETVSDAVSHPFCPFGRIVNPDWFLPVQNIMLCQGEFPFCLRIWRELLNDIRVSHGKCK